MNNSAIVARLNNVRNHPNADRLKLATVYGTQIIVSLDSEDGTLGVYFEGGLQLSEQFCQSNDLIRRKDENGNPAGGMFDVNRRVRAMNLRGEKSDGFFCTFDYLQRVGVSGSTVDSLTEGMQFNELDGIAICNKYETAATIAAKQNRQTVKRENNVIEFPEHFDTEQFRFNQEYAKTHSLVIITEKVHGTSQRYGNVKVRRKLSWVERIAQFFGAKIDATQYEYVIGTRRTILSDEKSGYYGNEQFRRDVVKDLTLHPDEILYFEVVGFTTDGKPIMPAHDATKVSKDFVRVWGNSVEYTYNCAPNTCKMIVYRITQNGRDLSWDQVKQRCNELGLQYVPELARFIVDDMRDVLYIVDELTDRASTVDPTIPQEGVCIRVEDMRGVKVFKNKAHAFKVMEGIIKDRSDVVDMEESA